MKKRMGLLCLIIGSATCFAELNIADVFSDHMVLQREKPVPVWGRADAGTLVTVEFAGQKKTAVTDSSNHWKVLLDPMAASSEPRVLQVSDSEFQVSLSDVLVGEVWLCSGQSNMGFPLSKAMNAEAEIRAADYPEIRLLKVEQRLDCVPRDYCEIWGGGWMHCSPEVAERFTAVGYFFGRELHKQLGIPIGLIQSAWGGSRIEAWTDWSRMKNDPVAGHLLPLWEDMIAGIPDYHQNFASYAEAFDARARELAKQKKDWEAAKREAIKNRKRFKEPMPKADPLLTPGNKHTPASIYNAMIVPLAPYALRGAIWYQGESNSSRPITYRAQLPLMIQNWRDLWGDQKMPFYVVQLANLGPQQQNPVESSAGFADLRDAQQFTVQNDPHMALATAVDIGESGDIHPKNKQEVGRRLALPALNRIYGKSYEDSGPVFESLKQDGNSLWLTFSHAGGMHAKGGDELKGFAIRSESGQWVWAKARIEGDRIELSADGVVAPVAARYSWARNPIGNLMNSAGLPAIPFRTDSQLSAQELQDQDRINEYKRSQK
ncbi:sialate O-acetylesterase [Tichowtungia aerotolerans]|uniref:Sialate O-acetylesterase n=1 Tax=Tichowtungia aerotolerans TaxID=2697043 RepID=A0A6P1M7K4_9BACT|nr:sialate O-acetylesterase [Tichowtungia aerotolerans]QHI69847.1 sialate O-acetylesterase [Tichowtungia aerotolerans]